MLNIKKFIKTQEIIRKIFLSVLLLFLFISGIYSQQFVVSGKVIDGATTDALPFVNVVVKGTTLGTISDSEGLYSLKIPDGQSILTFSFIGYEKLTIPVKGKEVINVTLIKASESLDELVVIGYGVQKKSDLSGAVASVKTEELVDIAATDIISSLKGKVAGVLVTTTSGAPGESSRILIRGASSIYASNEPLYMIDGVGGNINNINEHDIESIEILKDAASTAIYGAAGANGVVLVTTKHGADRKMKVNFFMKQGVQLKANPIKLLDSQQEYDLLKELNKSTPEFVSNYFYSDQDPRYPSSAHIDTTNWENVNWQDEIMQKASFQEFNLSLSGGNSKTKFFISSLYRKNEGIIKTAYADQYVFRVNLNNQVTDNFNILTNLNISKKNQKPVADNTEGWNGALINSAFTYPNFIPMYDPNDPGKFMVNPLRPQFDNPQAWIRGKSQSNSSTSINGLLQLKWEIIDGLTFISDNSVSYSSSNSDLWLNPYDTYNGRNANGEYTINFSEGLGIGTQNTLTWMKDIGRNSFSAMAGMIVSQGANSGNGVTGKNFSNDLIREISAATIITGKSNHGESFSASYIGRINYAYNRKYLAQFNIRADGSPYFGENNRWATFPSASLAWKISDESFFKDNISVINFFKIRGGYGLSGNKPGTNFMYMATYGPLIHGWQDAAYPINLTDALSPGYGIVNGENQDLKWETTKEISLGLDINMYDNRIEFSVDIYDRKAFDLLYILEPPMTFYDYSELGGTLGGLLMNIANTSNKGFEFKLSTRNIVGLFKWNTDLVFAYNENEVVSLGEDPIVNYDSEQVITPGYPLNAFWGNEVERLYQKEDFNASGKLLEGIPSQTNVKPGDIKFKNNNGDAVVNEDDKVYLGDPVPPFTYSMTNTITYANFDLTIFLQGVQGNKIWNKTRESTEDMSNNMQQFSTVLDRWTPENTNTLMPRAVLGDPAQNTRKSDRWVEDGSYFRIKDIVFGYNMPLIFLNRIRVDNTRIYFSAQNLFTLTNYTGYDPEVRPVDFSGYPQNKTFIIGVNITF